jgi:hypothetical protein
MGRVMGLSSLAMMGSFPLAAGVASGLTSAVGGADALVITGVVAITAAVLLGWGRGIRTA